MKSPFSFWKPDFLQQNCFLVQKNCSFIYRVYYVGNYGFDLLECPLQKEEFRAENGVRSDRFAADQDSASAMESFRSGV